MILVQTDGKMKGDDLKISEIVAFQLLKEAGTGRVKLDSNATDQRCGTLYPLKNPGKEI